MTEALAWGILIVGSVGAYAMLAAHFDWLAEREIKRHVDAVCPKQAALTQAEQAERDYSAAVKLHLDVQQFLQVDDASSS